MTPSKPPAYAWLMTAVCFWMALLAWGTVFYGNTVYLPALKAAHGWSTGLIANAMTLFFWLAIPVTLLFGWIADTVGTRLAVAYGGLAVGGGVAAMGWLTEPWQLYAAYALLATGYPLLATPAISASLVPWFGARLGLPLALALTGSSVGGAVSVPLMVQASTDYGFRATVSVIGGLVAVTMVPLALLALRRPAGADRPAAHRAETSFTLGDALRTPRFWRIALAGGLGYASQVGYLSHQLAYLGESLSAAEASYAISVGVLSGAVGRLVTGWLSTRMPLAWLAAATYLTQAVGIAIVLRADGLPAIYLGSAVAGFVIGNIVMLPPLLLRDAFGPAAYGRVYGFANIALYTGAGVGPGLAGWLRDGTGSYGGALMTFVAFHMVAAVMLLFPGIRPPRNQTEKPRP
ncbi:MAG: MFS transporter [Alphaproteobacteria bacterium]|nr:MFS transporter [Alphaproteobacteria bacterium]MCB9928357.1 MFS transporter [Alphaproteobacteria bacterium]